MQPNDYTSAFANLPSPQEAILSGLKTGIGISDMQMQRQQQQAAALRQQEMYADLAAASRDHNLLPGVMIKHPELAEKLKHGWEARTQEQQRSDLNEATEIYAALKSKRGDIAVDRFRSKAEAMQNSGDAAGAKRMNDMAQWAEIDPDNLMTMTATRIAALPGGDKVIKSLVEMGGEQRAGDLHGPAIDKAEADARAAGADATTKEVGAKYAEKGALLDIEKKGWDITKIKADIQIAKEDNRIKAMNAAYNREGNDLKRQELKAKIDDSVRARDEKVNERVAQAEGEIAAVTDTVNLIDEIFADPDTLKAVTGASAWRGMIPGTKSKTAAGKIEQLTNMLAAANLDKLKGPMSDKDILFVKRISGNIDRYQDEDLFAKEMGKVRDIMVRTEAKVRSKYGAPPPGKGSGTTPPPPGAREVVVDY